MIMLCKGEAMLCTSAKFPVCVRVPSGHYTLEQHLNLVTAQFQLNFDVVPISDSRCVFCAAMCSITGRYLVG